MAGPHQTSPSVSSAQPRMPAMSSRTMRSGGPAGPALLTMRSINGRPVALRDAYHGLLNMTWARFIGVIECRFCIIRSSSG